MRFKGRTDWLGDGLTALCGGALACNLLFVIALLLILVYNGMGFYWQQRVVEVELADGRSLLGEIRGRETIPSATGEGPHGGSRFRLKTGNRDLNGQDFVWIDDIEVVSIAYPEDVVKLERMEHGDYFGRVIQLQAGDQTLASGTNEVWQALIPLLQRKAAELRAVRQLERGEIGEVNQRIERLRLDERKLSLAALSEAEMQRGLAPILDRRAAAESEFEALSRSLFSMREELAHERVVLESSTGQRSELAVSEIVRAIPANRIGFWDRLRLYLSRGWEFLSADPRESNTEGGIFPAIFGTVMLVFIMSVAVTPLGVLAALYLREYARQGPMVRLVRIAVNNLAGVPSIVFGVFGLGFFVYTLGGSIDSLFFAEALPTPTYKTGGILWASLTLALLTVPVVIVATEEGLAAVPRIVREGSLALGATKFETIRKVVLPAAAPGMLTGLILAMARAAGEVAPLMIVGVVKLAPTLPLDGYFPYVHLERKFMHLGFHIYDVGFQSPNVEAAKPLVFATALLLIAVVTSMNLVAIAVRNHLRSKYSSSAV